MRNVLMGAALAAFAGTAMAAGDDLANAPDTSYAAKAYYRVDFGGSSRSNTQSVGLRFDSPLAESRGAPAFISASFSGVAPAVYLAGAPVAGYRLVANETGGDSTWYSALTGGQWFVLGLGLVVLGTVAVDNNADPGTHSSGSGN